MNFILALSVILNICLLAYLLSRKNQAPKNVLKPPTQTMEGAAIDRVDIHDLFAEMIIGYGINIVPGPVEQYIDKFQKKGFTVFHVHGNEISNKHDFFAEAARVFDFPDYFGLNWDAWNDCMRDFEDFAPDRSVIIWDGADHTYQNDSYVFLQAIYDLCNSAMAVSLGSCRANKLQKQMILLVIK